MERKQRKKPIVFCEQRTLIYNNKTGKKRTWFSDNVRMASIGYELLGYKVIGFLQSEIEMLPAFGLTKKTPVRGNLHNVRKIFDILGVKQPENIDLPECIRHHAKRKVWVTTLGELRKTKARVHIKPYRYQKLFDGEVFNFGSTKTSDPEYVSQYVRQLPNSFEVLASEVIDNFGIEKRIFVLNGKIPQCYSSECYSNFAKQVIKDYGKEAPAAYAIDIAFDYTSNTARLIEINDGFSAGNDCYISEKLFAQIHLARWNEICSNKTK